MSNPELSTVWHGATWRSFGEPIPAPPIPVRPPNVRTAEEARAKLWAVLTDQWQTRRTLQDRACMSYDGVVGALQGLMRQGKVEYHATQGTAHRPRQQRFYRRAQAVKETAA